MEQWEEHCLSTCDIGDRVEGLAHDLPELGSTSEEHVLQEDQGTLQQNDGEEYRRDRHAEDCHRHSVH